MCIRDSCKEALDFAILAEQLCDIYWRTMQSPNGSSILNDSQMADVHAKNENYGQGKPDIDGNEVMGKGLKASKDASKFDQSQLSTKQKIESKL